MLARGKPPIPREAFAAGTVGQIDRSRQYEGRVYNSESLRRNDDLLFARQRKLEKERFWHAVLIIVISCIAANFVKIAEAILWAARLV
jgi:hypothetical protein